MNKISFTTFFLFISITINSCLGMENNLTLENISPFPFIKLSPEQIGSTVLLPEGGFIKINESKKNPNKQIILTPCHPCIAVAVTGQRINSDKISTIAFHVWPANDIADAVTITSKYLIKNNQLRLSLFSKKMDPRLYQYLWSHVRKESQSELIRTIKKIFRKEFAMPRSSINTTLITGNEYEQEIDRTVLINGSIDAQGFTNFFSCEPKKLLSIKQRERFREISQKEYLESTCIWQYGELLPFREIKKEYFLSLMATKLHTNDQNNAIKNWHIYVLHGIK